MANGKGLLSQGQKEQALYQGLLQLGAQLSAGSGGNRPVSTLQALSQGGAGFADAYGQNVDKAKNRAIQQREMDYQDEVRKRESDKLASQAAYRMSLPPSVRQQAEAMGIPQFAAAEYQRSQTPAKETFETVENPFGKGGIYQKSLTTGKMAPVYTPPKETQPKTVRTAEGIFNLNSDGSLGSRLGSNYSDIGPIWQQEKDPETGLLIQKNIKTGEIKKAPTQEFSDTKTNAALFASRMDAAEDILTNPDIIKEAIDPAEKAASMLPLGLGNYAVSDEYRQYDQARRDFINAVLRRESGAAIAESEFENANKQYFPQSGDDPATIKQKERNRKLAIQGIKRAAGGAYKPNAENIGSERVDELSNPVIENLLNKYGGE